MQIANQHAASVSRIDRQTHRPGLSRPPDALFAHRLKSPDAAFVARSTRFDAGANPSLFDREFFVEQCILFFLRQQRLFFAFEKRLVIAFPIEEFAPIDLEDPIGDFGQERAIVRDEDQRLGEASQKRFEPQNRVDVQVVCRLVEQQYIRGADDRFAQKRTSFQADR